MGRRVGRTKNGDTRRYLLDDGNRLLAEYNQAGNIVSQYVYLTRSHVPDFMIQGSNVYRFVTDQLGSVRLVVNVNGATASGAVVQEIVYDAWGQVTSVSSAFDQPFGFAGGIWDRDTGLVHFGAREYDPETGRWLQKDPIRFAGGDSNLYGYVGGDPVNLVDPTGLSAWGWFQFIVRTSDIRLGITNSLGIVYGTIGALGDGTFEGVDDNGNMIFMNTTFERMTWNSRTIGDVICYSSSTPSQRAQDHENAHTKQHTSLGPGYIPAHLLSIGFSYAVTVPPSYDGFNYLEDGPHDMPPHPWPW